MVRVCLHECFPRLPNLKLAVPRKEARVSTPLNRRKTKHNTTGCKERSHPLVMPFHGWGFHSAFWPSTPLYRNCSPVFVGTYTSNQPGIIFLLYRVSPPPKKMDHFTQESDWMRLSSPAGNRSRLVYIVSLHSQKLVYPTAQLKQFLHPFHPPLPLVETQCTCVESLVVFISLAVEHICPPR